MQPGKYRLLHLTHTVHILVHENGTAECVTSHTTDPDPNYTKWVVGHTVDVETLSPEKWERIGGPKSKFFYSKYAQDPYALENFPVIGIAGLKGSGKNYLADLFKAEIAEHTHKDVVLMAFADPIREACSVIFGWTMEQMLDREFKETIDPKYGVSPRDAIETLGTKWGRGMVNDNLWVKRLEQRIIEARAFGKLVIVTDVRYDNEADLIRHMEGEIVEVVPDITYEAARDQVDPDNVFEYFTRTSQRTSNNRITEKYIQRTLLNNFSDDFNTQAISLIADLITQG